MQWLCHWSRTTDIAAELVQQHLPRIGERVLGPARDVPSSMQAHESFLRQVLGVLPRTGQQVRQLQQPSTTPDE